MMASRSEGGASTRPPSSRGEDEEVQEWSAAPSAKGFLIPGLAHGVLLFSDQTFADLSGIVNDIYFIAAILTAFTHIKKPGLLV